MTPLEEIEAFIDYCKEESDEYDKIRLLAPLYQARAIERLEATVRAFAVMIQETIQELKDKDEAGQ